MKHSLSVVISAYNEEKRIGICIDSVQNLADEVIVINNSSTDKTVEIAKKHGAQVITRENFAMLNINKNFGFTKAKGEWILNLDADEQITIELKEEIKKFLGRDEIHENGFLIPRKNIIFGKWIQNSIWWPDYQLRMFRKGKGMFAEKHVHELLEVEGEVGKLESPIQHDNYSSVSQWVQKMDRIYTNNEAEQFIASGKSVEWYDAIRFPVQDFLKTFFMQKGYRDGLHGLVLSILQAFYAEIVFAKIWEKQGFPQKQDSDFLIKVRDEFRKVSAEFGYWITHSFIEEKKSKSSFYLKLLRKYYKSRT